MNTSGVSVEKGRKPLTVVRDLELVETTPTLPKKHEFYKIPKTAKFCDVIFGGYSIIVLSRTFIT